MRRVLQEHFSGTVTQSGASGRRLQKGPAGVKGRKVTQAGAKRLTHSDSKKKKAASVTNVSDFNERLSSVRGEFEVHF